MPQVLQWDDLAEQLLAQGKAYYAWLARRYTTTSLTPDEIHAIGLKEVARIRAEMDGIRATQTIRSRELSLA